MGNCGCPLPGVRASAGDRGTSLELHGKCVGLTPFTCSVIDSELHVGDNSVTLLWGETLPLVDDEGSFVACTLGPFMVGVEGELSIDCFFAISVEYSFNIYNHITSEHI